ncbi:MAG: amidohydrolase [Bacteroidetes bacterium]|nr:MAG: amidohydrolase [Bacteroidota bacterium]
MKKSAAFILLILLVASISFTSCVRKTRVDLILYNGKVYTVDSSFSVQQAFAIKDGKLLEVGDSKSILGKYEAADTIDAKGNAVYPGLMDAHAHFYAYAMGLTEVDLVGANSWQECVDRIKSYASAHKLSPGQWIVGRGWDQNDWEKKEFPDRELLDKDFPNNPIYLSRVDGHAALVNQKALELASIKPGQTLTGGVVEMKNNRLTGILVDNATGIVEQILPSSNDSAFLSRAFQEAQQNCFAQGLTTIEDCGLMKQQVDQLDSLQKAGLLKMKLVVLLSDAKSNYEYYLKAGTYKTPRLNVNGFKLYADGALGSRGACLLQPYSDKPGWYGFLLSNLTHYDSVLSLIVNSPFQACTHAIGDSGNRMILQAYARQLKGPNDRRWRIEHAQVINESDFEWFGKYNIVPSVQPTHATSDMYWAGDRLGKERLKGAYAFKKLLDENGWIALGTDFPVEDISPFKTFFAAVIRKDAKNFPEGGFQMENALTRMQALRGMTIWAAKGAFEEKEKGSIEKGKDADFIITDKNIMECDPQQILQTKVKATYINGEKVFEAK